jgi:hypothetical protein
MLGSMKSLCRFRYLKDIFFAENLKFIALQYRFSYQITSIFLEEQEGRNINVKIDGKKKRKKKR